jgi:sugar phosphate isomerase/epimerase
MLSAQGGILANIVDGTDPRYVGVSLDIAHLTVEGSIDGWRQGIDLLQERVGIVAVKSFAWFHEPDATTGGTRWTPKIVPLAEGSARWRDAFALLRQTGWDADGTALVSLHSEYQGSASWRELSVDDLIAQTRDDIAWLRRQADSA